jgi:hypothetical protein
MEQNLDFFWKSYMHIISYKTKYDNNQNNDWYFITLQIKKVTSLLFKILLFVTKHPTIINS